MIYKKLKYIVSTINVKQLNKSQTKLLCDFLEKSSFTNTMSHHPVHAAVAEWLPLDGGSVLELGCGPGKYVAMLSKLGFCVTGVDPMSFPTWELLRKEENITLFDNIYAEALPFKDHQFDHAVCLGALLYFHNPDKAMQELKRVVKPGGKLIVRSVNSFNFYTLYTGNKLDPASRQLYTMVELEDLLKKSGFSVNNSFSYGFWPPVLTDFWWYLQCVWIPLYFQEILSNMTPVKNRVNNIVFATA